MKRILTLIIALSTVVAALAISSKESQLPLYIVDGKAMSLESVQQIPSEDIESVTIYKDEEQVQRFKHLGDVSNGVIAIILKEKNEAELNFIAVDVMPTFMGGDLQAFQRWVMQSTRYPAEAIDKKLEDNVVVQFVVSRDGYINADDIKVLQAKHKVFADEVVRVISTSPQWTPGMQKNQPVNVSFVLPVMFSLGK